MYLYRHKRVGNGGSDFDADTNQYQYLRLIFSIDNLSDNYTDIQLMLFLKENITGQLMGVSIACSFTIYPNKLNGLLWLNLLLE